MTVKCSPEVLILAHGWYDCPAIRLRGSRPMRALLAFSRLIDYANECVGRAVAWLVLAAVLISAGNATARYAFNLSSNAWLEIQWYLFSAIFLLGAGWTLKRNARVRMDIVA